MDYRLELLDDQKFENLVNNVCQKILGTGVITFAPGKDGGRDGKFTGKAENFPSKSNPWENKFIIQAKLTSNPISSCSDNEFSKLIDLEIPKIKKLKADGDINNYLIFTNRKYTGVLGEKLLKRIKKETGIENIEIIGKETLNIHLNQNRDIVKLFELDKHHIPFDFSDEEIKEIIIAFKGQLPKITEDIKLKIVKVKYDFDFIKTEDKREKNKLGKEYLENEIIANSLMDFDKIQLFLDDDKNTEFKEFYFDIATELSSLITLKREDFIVFEELFIFIYQKIADGSTSLKGSKRHIMTLLHYMYMECLIGLK
jgi:hypothetical protein